MEVLARDRGQETMALAKEQLPLLCMTPITKFLVERQSVLKEVVMVPSRV